jgi:epoxyqueuosine reductase
MSENQFGGGKMSENIIRKALEQGIKLAIVPIEYLEEVKVDLELLAEHNDLNELQKWIISKRYILDAPHVDFEPKSIVVAVWQLDVAKAIFQYYGKSASCIIEDSFSNTDVHDRLSKVFAEYAYSLSYVDWMPQKRLAVRSGLCEYGRNNITYCGEWGSFIRLGTYISDAPAKDNVWRDVVNMEFCDTCGICINHCPTNAILSDRFLINNEICLANLNSFDNRDIPDWVPSSAHHRLIECTCCQENCPVNYKLLSQLRTIEFSDTETKAILSAESFMDFPDGVRKKLWYYDNGEPFKCIPRNLRLMLENMGE